MHDRPVVASLTRSLSGIAAALAVTCFTSALYADVKVPSIFGSHMVLQQGQNNPVWGKADAGEKVTVTIAGQTHSATAGDDGKWKVKLDPLPAGGPHTLSIQGNNSIVLEDVLVGEVWLCSGQSNMQWPVAAATDPDLETRTAHYPQIRLITVPQVGTQEPQDDFAGSWQPCTPETVGEFSAVGYFFGRQLHQTLQVPVGPDRQLVGRLVLRGLGPPRPVGSRPALPGTTRAMGSNGEDLRSRKADGRIQGKEEPVG